MHNDGDHKFKMLAVADRTATRVPELVNHTVSKPDDLTDGFGSKDDLTT